ncbi:hypothetical protein B0H13DRAFT_2463488 [Mycena leptocephala]|nr:hypothetical protein B0H13DRAFT_2463488 [Mycena leptocephala]
MAHGVSPAAPDLRAVDAPQPFSILYGYFDPDALFPDWNDSRNSPEPAAQILPPTVSSPPLAISSRSLSYPVPFYHIIQPPTPAVQAAFLQDTPSALSSLQPEVAPFYPLLKKFIRKLTNLDRGLLRLAEVDRGARPGWSSNPNPSCAGGAGGRYMRYADLPVSSSMLIYPRPLFAFRTSPERIIVLAVLCTGVPVLVHALSALAMVLLCPRAVQ